MGERLGFDRLFLRSAKVEGRKRVFGPDSELLAKERRYLRIFVCKKLGHFLTLPRVIID